MVETAIRLGFRPLPNSPQADFFYSSAARPCYRGPAGIGKTMTGAAKLILNVIRFPSDCLVLAPVYTQHMIRATLPTYLKMIPEEIVKRTADGEIFHKSERRIQVQPPWPDLDSQGKPLVDSSGRIPPPTIRSIWFGGTDEPENIYGGNFGTVHLDEASQMHEDAFQITQHRLRGEAEPRQMLGTYTPRGDKGHWTYRLWGHGSPNHKDYPVFTMTHDDCPWLSEEDKRLWRESAGDSVLAQQELTGEYMDFGGLVYPMFGDQHIRPAPLVRYQRVAAGIDFGIRSATTVIVVGEDPQGYLWAVREFYRQNCTDKELLTECGTVLDRWPHIRFYADRSEPDQITRLRAWGIPCTKSDSDMKVGVPRIRSLLEPDATGKPGLYVDPDCIYLIGEFGMWSYKRNVRRSTFALSDQFEDRNDHALDALRYAIMALGNTYYQPIPTGMRVPA